MTGYTKRLEKLEKAVGKNERLSFDGLADVETSREEDEVIDRLLAGQKATREQAEILEGVMNRMRAEYLRQKRIGN